ncbi:hypothetical protein BOPS111487_21220 [Bordetella pseudohinzii]
MALFVLDIALAGEHGSEFQAGLRGDVVKDQFLAIGLGGIGGEGQLPRGQRAAGLGLVVRAATDEDLAVLAGEMEGLITEVQGAAVGELDAGLALQFERPFGMVPPGSLAIDKNAGRSDLVALVHLQSWGAEGGGMLADQAAAVLDLDRGGAAHRGVQAFVEGDDARCAADQQGSGIVRMEGELGSGMRDNGATVLDLKRAVAVPADVVFGISAESEGAVVADSEAGAWAADHGLALMQIERVYMQPALVLHV